MGGNLSGGSIDEGSLTEERQAANYWSLAVSIA
jgi:hypothetical protein